MPALDMVRAGERFYTSLGFAPLPKTFFERSLLRPAEGSRRRLPRQRVGHRLRRRHPHQDVHRADRGGLHDDPPRARTQLLPARLQGSSRCCSATAPTTASTRRSATPIALSVTPEYLVKIGLLDKAPDTSRDIGLLMNKALEKIAFLPFGLLIDQWRWKVFSGEITPAEYNKAWWDLKLKYQGVAPPSARGEEFFDPGAKYHVPDNTPYTRYFLADILQFQFHRALSKTAGCTLPLNRCSIYESKAAGERLNAMLSMGQSRPWPEALEALTGIEADGRDRDPRLLRAAVEVARRTAQRQEGRVVGTGPQGTRPREQGTRCRAELMTKTVWLIVLLATSAAAAARVSRENQTGRPELTVPNAVRDRAPRRGRAAQADGSHRRLDHHRTVRRCGHRCGGADRRRVAAAIRHRLRAGPSRRRQVPQGTGDGGAAARSATFARAPGSSPTRRRGADTSETFSGSATSDKVSPMPGRRLVWIATAVLGAALSLGAVAGRDRPRHVHARGRRSGATTTGRSCSSTSSTSASSSTCAARTAQRSGANAATTPGSSATASSSAARSSSTASRSATATGEVRGRHTSSRRSSATSGRPRGDVRSPDSVTTCRRGRAGRRQRSRRTSAA